jgi:hypothetical protein
MYNEENSRLKEKQMKSVNRIWICLLAVSMLLLPVACKGKNGKVIGTAAGYEVYYEELRYVTLICKDSLESRYGEGIWDTDASAEQYRAELEEMVWDTILNNYLVLAACAVYGYTPSDMENENIQAAVDAQIEQTIEECGGKKAFKKQLEEYYMTEDFLRFTLSVAQMENELRLALQDAGKLPKTVDAFMTWMEEGNAVYVQHILIRNDEGDDPAANRALAESLQAQLANGEVKIEDLVGKAATNEESYNIMPYYVVRGVSEQAFETAVFVLDTVGDVSEVVEADGGYYVFVRVQEEITDGVNLTMMKKVSELYSSYQWAKTEEFVQAQRSNVKIDLNDFGKSIDLLEID